MDELERLKNQLFAHALAERNAFLDEIRQLTPDQIIPRAYEIAMKEDFYYNMTEVSEFNPHELRVLATMEKPLAACYKNWSYFDQTDYNEDLQVCIEDVIYKEKYRRAQMKYANPATPVYTKSWKEAYEVNELADYEASQSRNYACLTAFERGYRNCVKESGEGSAPVLDEKAFASFQKEWQKDFGQSRCLYVLAGVVRLLKNTEQFSPSVLKAAEKVVYPPEYTDKIILPISAAPRAVDLTMRGLVESQRKTRQPER